MTMQEALNQKLSMVRGDTNSWLGQVTDPDNDDEPINITGCTMTWTVKRDIADGAGAAVIRKTVGNGITLTTPAAGLFKLGPLLPTDTSVLDDEFVGLVFDVEMVDLAGNVVTVAKGTLFVSPDSSS